MKSVELEKNIGVLVENAATRFNEKEVLRFHPEDEVFSFNSLNEHVNRFANALAARGISSGDHVAVMLPNRPEFPLTWLALAKMGAVMVPLNTRYQAVDLRYVLNDSDAVALITDADLLPQFREVMTETPKVREVLLAGKERSEEALQLSDLVDKASPRFSSADITADALLNIQYTSGTTGFPKGCMLTHEYWMTLGMNAAETMLPDDVFLSVTPFYYMDPQWELIMCLTIGCTMVITRKYSATKYMNLVRQYDVSVAWATMAPWTFKQPESPLDRQHRLRFVFVGGMPPGMHKPFEERFNVAAREAYGMTEIGIGMYVPLEDAHMSGSGSVGKPPEFRQVKIVNDAGEEVKPGQTGELLIKGPGMFKGYYKKPQETAEAFDQGWFHTGDLFRQDNAGYFYIVGRKKDMIRRSGDNISASEVEYVLTSHPLILSAAVVPVPDENRGEEVKAYVVLADDQTPETVPPGEIVTYCSERIADFKVPRYIEYKARFSMTPSDKIKKHLLLEEKEDLTAGCYDRMSST
jgi:acyl-CoA synthetase (AMP-forming)/AMP-acid ligase II